MSRRFASIDFDLERIEPFLNGRELLSYQLLSGGKINSNYRIELVGGEVYLLRFYARSSAAPEQHAMSFVRDALPVPEVLYAGEGWAIMQFLRGVPLQEEPEAATAVGRALAKISAVEFARPGALIPDESNESVESLPFDGLEGFINLCLDNAEVQGWLGPETVKGVQRLLQREATRFAELNGEARLVHGDFNPTNILVSEGEVTGILDWEFAHSGTPSMDIGNLLRNLGPAYDEMVARGLKEGGMDLLPDWRERAALVDLASHMEFLTSTHDDDFKRVCVGRVEALLKNSYANDADTLRKTQIAEDSAVSMKNKRLAQEVMKLDPIEEEVIAEEGIELDSEEWAEY